MRILISFLTAILLLLITGCSWFENDDNTVNPIPKHHNTYPVFHLKIDNDYQMFGVDSVLLTVEPDIGWLESVYTDTNGFIGTLGSGTYITSIDTAVISVDSIIIDTTVTPIDTTVISVDSIIIDTTSVVFGFNPQQAYTFSFTRPDTFTWIDSFRIDYAMTIDSAWDVVSADTAFTSKTFDPSRTPIFKYDSIGIFHPDSLLVPPDSIYEQEVYYAEWFFYIVILDTISPDPLVIDTTIDTTISTHIMDPLAQLPLAPDTTYYDTLLWGFWGIVDSFYLPVDSAGLCELAMDTILDTISTDPLDIDTTINDFFVEITVVSINPDFLPYITIDTFQVYINCDPTVAQSKRRFYRTYDWTEFDTTVHFTFPDTTKQLIFENGMVTVNNTESEVSKATTMYFIDANGNMSTVDGLVFNLTIPAVEVFPHYQIILKDE
ncbi:MAG: hypothetical protein V3V99_01695 [candidate division Zixibacteria bacterium]